MSSNTTKPREYKVIALRECPTPEAMQFCDTPAKAAEYWNLHIKTSMHFNPECECFAVVLLNTRKRIKGHHLVSIGTIDTILVHPREVFRTAIVGGGRRNFIDAQPSERRTNPVGE